jgi:hypothetical protein
MVVIDDKRGQPGGIKRLVAHNSPKPHCQPKTVADNT